MSEHVWNQAAIDAAERDRQDQKTKATVDTLGVIVKAATNLNCILAGVGKLPNAAWHEQFHNRPVAENCAAVEKLLAAAPFTSQDDGLRVFHVRNLIISKLAPAAEAMTAARPAPAPAVADREAQWKNEWRADASLRRDFPETRRVPCLEKIAVRRTDAAHGCTPRATRKKLARDTKPHSARALMSRQTRRKPPKEPSPPALLEFRGMHRSHTLNCPPPRSPAPPITRKHSKCCPPVNGPNMAAQKPTLLLCGIGGPRKSQHERHNSQSTRRPG